MCRTTLVIGLLLFNIILEQYPIRAAQSLDDFFPFGLQVGDTKMVPNDDESYGPIPLPHIFPYFDNNHQQIYQANNGLFSFLGGISTFNPISFPLADDQRLITPFWSDIDTRGQTNDSSENSVYHHIYTTNTSNSSNVTTTVLDKAAGFVRQYFPSETAFVPLMVITGTWYRVGYFSFGLNRLNTFQMVLTTDESRSFAFFFYNDLQWASQHPFGPYAQAGFNAGDGIVAKMLKYSRTSNITQLVNESNVNVPGLFAFRIDTKDIEAGGCGEHESLSHTPTRGRQIGGTTINLHGPCFDVNITEVLCRFGDFGNVSGLVVNQFRVICVSPLAPYSGDVELAVSFDGGVTFNTSGIFTYMITTEDILASEEVILRQNDNPTKVVSWNGTIEIEWMFSNTLLARLPSDAFIDIIYEKLKPDEEQTRRRRQVSSSDVNI